MHSVSDKTAHPNPRIRVNGSPKRRMQKKNDLGVCSSVVDQNWAFGTTRPKEGGCALSGLRPFSQVSLGPQAMHRRRPRS